MMILIGSQHGNIRISNPSFNIDPLINLLMRLASLLVQSQVLIYEEVL